MSITCVYILTCICCLIPESKGEEWFRPSGHLSLLASIQTRTMEGNIKRRNTKASDPGVVLYSHITLSFCGFICQNTKLSVLFGSEHKYVLFHKCMWVVGWREGDWDVIFGLPTSHSNNDQLKYMWEWGLSAGSSSKLWKKLEVYFLYEISWVGSFLNIISNVMKCLKLCFIKTKHVCHLQKLCSLANCDFRIRR